MYARIVSDPAVLGGSPSSSARLASRVPFDTERGYVVMLTRPGVEVRHALISGDYHLAITPMEEGAPAVRHRGVRGAPRAAELRARREAGRRGPPRVPAARHGRSDAVDELRSR